MHVLFFVCLKYQKLIVLYLKSSLYVLLAALLFGSVVFYDQNCNLFVLAKGKTLRAQRKVAVYVEEDLDFINVSLCGS